MILYSLLASMGTAHMCYIYIYGSKTNLEGWTWKTSDQNILYENIKIYTNI